MENKYQCEYCKKIFTESEIKLMPLAGNFNLIGVQIMVRNTKSNKNYFTTTIQSVDGDCVICCPHCSKPHLFGFDRVSENGSDKDAKVQSDMQAVSV